MKKLLLWILIVSIGMVVIGCPSHRKNANCAEIRYRLDHMDYTPDQKEWIEQEWEQCKVEADSLAALDQVKYGSIYQQFSAQDSASNADSTSKTGSLGDTSAP